MSVRAAAKRMLLCFLLTGGGSVLFAQELSLHDLLSPPSLDTLSSNPVVARVGPGIITAREFFFSYLFGPSFVKKRPDSRRRYLQFMIYEKLLALGAEASGKRNDRRLVENVIALEGDVATEELYRDDILNKVRVTNKEVDHAARLQRVTVSLRWLYAKNQAEVDTFARKLLSGNTFDSLFQRQFLDSSLRRDDRMMEATLFEIMRRNGALAPIVERLAVGSPSEPIKAPDGWYIVRIDSQWTSIMPTESEDVQARSDARRVITQMKADSLSARYVRRLMLEANPVIQRRTFDILGAHLAAKILPPERSMAWGLGDRFRQEKDSVDYVHAEKYASQVLVAMRHGKISLGDFLQWYRLRELNITLRLSSPQAYFLSLEDLVWRMVRDSLLVNRAASRHLQERQSVVTQKHWWSDKLLYQLAKDSLRRTISWTDSTLRVYLAEHPRSFRDSSGAVKEFAEVKDDVLREWYEMALSERLLHTLARLKVQFPVSVEEGNLRRIPVDAENDPRAIEVVAAKKGGTFPHPAFPTIDTFWQTWQ